MAWCNSYAPCGEAQCNHLTRRGVRHEHIAGASVFLGMLRNVRLVEGTQEILGGLLPHSCSQSAQYSIFITHLRLGLTFRLCDETFVGISHLWHAILADKLQGLSFKFLFKYFNSKYFLNSQNCNTDAMLQRTTALLVHGGKGSREHRNTLKNNDLHVNEAYVFPFYRNNVLVNCTVQQSIRDIILTCCSKWM